MKMLALGAILVVMLSGCTTQLGDDSFDLSLTGPNHAIAGFPTTYSLEVAGEPATETDHIGAHFWASEPQDPTGEIGDSTACAHVVDELPGTFAVVCTFENPGTYHLLGHARAEDFNFWAPTMTVTVLATDDAYSLNTANTVTATDGPFAFELMANGMVEMESDHIGAHYFAQDTETPTASGSDGACGHVVGSIPGTFDVTCELPSGTWYVRGHVRIANGEDTYNYWSESFQVVAS